MNQRWYLLRIFQNRYGTSPQIQEAQIPRWVNNSTYRNEIAVTKDKLESIQRKMMTLKRNGNEADN